MWKLVFWLYDYSHLRSVYLKIQQLLSTWPCIPDPDLKAKNLTLTHSLGLDIAVKKLTWTIISDPDRATVESTWTHIPFLDLAAM
jgi:hypothetical protein